MSSHHYGPSLSDQGIGPEDAHVGSCANCTQPLDVAAMEAGGGVYVRETLMCRDCATGNYRCVYGCGTSVASAGQCCSECAAYGDA